MNRPQFTIKSLMLAVVAAAGLSYFYRYLGGTVVFLLVFNAFWNFDLIPRRKIAARPDVPSGQAEGVWPSDQAGRPRSGPGVAGMASPRGAVETETSGE